MRTRTGEEAVSSVLDRMERHARITRLAVLGAAAAEAALLAFALYALDWSDRTQVLVLVFSILGYTIVALGLVALAAHVSRVGARVVAALDERGHR